MTTTEKQIIYRKYEWKDYQYVAQPRITSYAVHKNIAVTTDITFTKKEYKCEFNENTTEEQPIHKGGIWKITTMKYNQQLDSIRCKNIKIQTPL